MGVFGGKGGGSTLFVGRLLGSLVRGYSSELMIAILSPPLFDRYSAGVGALMTNRSAFGSEILVPELLGET